MKFVFGVRNVTHRHLPTHFFTQPPTQKPPVTRQKNSHRLPVSNPIVGLPFDTQCCHRSTPPSDLLISLRAASPHLASTNMYYKVFLHPPRESKKGVLFVGLGRDVYWQYTGIATPAIPGSPQTHRQCQSVIFRLKCFCTAQSFPRLPFALLLREYEEYVLLAFELY